MLRTALTLLVAGALAGLGSPGAARGASPDISSNWAGYALVARADRSPSFTAVHATWRLPATRCTGARSAASFWVGLGGYGDDASSVQQAGTDADCAGSRSRYYAWYEIVPGPSVHLALEIEPGDRISVSVALTPRRDRVLFDLRDLTTGARATRRVASVDRSPVSAEWIVETPATCANNSCRTATLARFGSVTFSAAQATAAGVEHPIGAAAWIAVPLWLVPIPAGAASPGGPPAQAATSTSPAGALPGELGAGGTSFAVTWKANAARAALADTREAR